MSQDLMANFFGSTERVFVFERKDQAGNPYYVVRPAVVLVDGNQIRFRNFTAHPVNVRGAFLASGSIDLAGGERKTVGLAGSPAAGFYEYVVTVTVAGKPVEAVGDSRPGAIIDR
jgi:hypothetical protein